MSFRLTGLIAATFAPLDRNGQLNLSRIEPMVDFLIAKGVAGLYVNGSTGEGPSLTTAERKQTAEAYVAAAARRLPVVVQVGHNSLEDAKDLAQHAQKIGAQAVSAVAPSYFKPASIESLLGCISQIASGAPELPFYYYHIPSLTGVQLDLPTLLRRAAEQIPSFAGIKYTAPTLWEYQACLAVDDGRFDCLFGLDEMLLAAMSVGARGAVGSTYNFAAPLYSRLMKAYESGNIEQARGFQVQTIDMIRVLLQHGGIPAFKAVMKLIGQDCGPVRLPLMTLADEAIRALERDLREIGYFSWIEQG